eukprot:tig00020952_g16473.t1
MFQASALPARQHAPAAPQPACSYTPRACANSLAGPARARRPIGCAHAVDRTAFLGGAARLHSAARHPFSTRTSRPFFVAGAAAGQASASAGAPSASRAAGDIDAGEERMSLPARLFARILDGIFARRGEEARTAWQLMRPESGRLARGLASAAVATTTNVISPLLFGSLIDSVFAGDRARFWRTVAGMVVIYVLEPLLTALYVSNMSAAGERSLERLRRALLAALLRERIQFFDETPLALPFLLVLGPVAMIAVIFGTRAVALAGEEARAVGGANALAGEVVSNIRTVRTFSSSVQAAIADRFGEEAGRAGRAARAAGRAAGLKEAVTRASINLTILAVAVFGGRLVLAGRMRPGVMSSFLGYSFSLNFALQGLSYSASDLRNAAGPASRVLGTLLRAPAPEEKEASSNSSPPSPSSPSYSSSAEGEGRTPTPAALHGRVAFRGVRFRYPSRPETLVLDDLSFEIEPGQKLALVGPSGAGKSTVTHLLNRFYEPEAGSIEVDGREIGGVSRDWLRDHVAVVGQEPALFSGTIRENIAYGRRGAAAPDAAIEAAPHAAIEAAARAAFCHDFIAGLPDGYETRVGERGVQLSGGQRQRIAIARALLKDPSVLVRGADAIAVLLPGRKGFAELGTHEELLALPGGAYRALIERQATI